jgi:hypothetical protein
MTGNFNPKLGGLYRCVRILELRLWLKEELTAGVGIWMRPLATIRKDDEVVILDMDITEGWFGAQCNLAKMLNKDGIVGWTVWFPEDWLFVQ